MAGSTINISLTKPEATDATKIREDFNNNMDLIDDAFEDALAYDTSPVLRGNLDIGAFNIEGVDATEFGYLNGISSFGGTLINDVDASAARTTLGLAIGTDVQAYDAGLLSIAGLTTIGGSVLYTTALDSYAVVAPNTAATNKFFRMIGTGSAYQAPSWETLEAGDIPDLSGTYQPLDGALTSISGLTYVENSFIKLTANDTYAVRTLTETKEDLDVDDLENVTNAMDSSGIVTGGVVSEGTNAGTFKVTAITEAYLRASASATAALMPVTLAEQDNQTITAADTIYFVIFTYGTPCTITISETTPNGYNAIPLGKVMKDGSDNVHYIDGGFRFGDGVRKLHQRAKTLRALELETGSAISYSGTNNFTMGTGIVYGGLNRFSLSAYDSSTTQFTYVYSDGGAGWTEAGSNVIDYAHYDDGDGTLRNIGNNKYSVHYVYKHIDDEDVYVVYGTGSYTLAEAEVQAIIPPTVPDHLAAFGCQIGAIVAPQSGSSFTAVIMVTSQFFSGTEVVNHNNLGGLQGGTAGEEFHLTETQHTNNAYTTDKLSAFAATTSAELADTISDEEGTGKVVYNIAPTIYSRVTSKTTTATLTVAEAGTVLVSASSDYTITLPTAVGNTGLTYKFKKTDANYNCITLDGNGSETINYENADGVPKLTYPRLNTYGAEVTLVSDGSNWQVYDEKLGQVPRCEVYLSVHQLNLTYDQWTPIEFNTKDYDIGSNYDISTWVSGNATSTSANHLVDSGGAFTSAMVNKRVKNTTDSTYTYITAYNSETDVTVRDDIFVDTEGYEIKNAKFISPISGKYLITPAIIFYNVLADIVCKVSVRKNGTDYGIIPQNHTSNTSDLTLAFSKIYSLSKDDYAEIVVQNTSGGNTVDIYGGSYTRMQIRLISKD